jgi:hypothetical protein
MDAGFHQLHESSEFMISARPVSAKHEIRADGLLARSMQRADRRRPPMTDRENRRTKLEQIR